MSITIDATKLWARPASAAEWTELLGGTGLPNPNGAWPCTEGSGNLADVIGSLTLAATGTPLYAQSATGWAGTGVAFDDNTTDGFVAAAGAGPDPSTTSQVWLFVIALAAEPAGARILGGPNINGAAFCRVGFVGGGTNSLRVGCNTVNTNGAADHVAGDYVVVLTYDRAGTRVVGYSDLETVTGTYSAGVTDGNKGAGRSSALGSCVVMYMAMWSGTNAEGLDDTDIATIRSRIESPPSGLVAEDEPPATATGRMTVGPSVQRPRSVRFLPPDNDELGAANFFLWEDQAPPYPRAPMRRPVLRRGPPVDDPMYPTPAAPVVIDPPGPTLDAWQAGGINGKWVCSIEGYSYLLTDATSAQVAEAWDGTDFTQALHGLYVRLDNEQELNPWEPFTSGGQLTLSIAPDAADQFGIDTHKAAGTESLMTTTVDCDDGTFTLKSATNFASSGNAYVGGEAVAYAGKSATQLTGVTRGKFSPFGCDPSGLGGDRFAHAHTVATDPNGVNLLPVVATTPRPEWWVGKWVGLWRHLLDVGTGLLNTRDDAQLCFAGRITEIHDNPDTGCTDVEVQHVLDVLQEATIGVDAYQARLKEGISLAAQWRFKMRDRVAAGAWLEADDLVVTIGASGPNEVEADVYTLDEIFDFLRDWLAAEKIAGRLSGDYDIGLKDVDGETRAAFYYYFEGAGDDIDFVFKLPEDVNAVFGTIPTVGLGSNVAAGYREVQIQDEPGAESGQQFLYHISLHVPLRHKHTPNGTFQLYDERNAVYDQGSTLPSQLQWWAGQHGGDRGLFLIDGSLFAGVYTAGSPSTLTYLWPFLPSGTTVSDLNNLQITVDDPRGPIEVRQVGAYEDSFGNLVKKLLYSTGTEGYNHATFDVLPSVLCFGGIPGELLGTEFEESVDQLPGADVPILMLIDKPRKLPDVLGGDLILRWAFLRWNNEHLELRTYTTPLTGTAFTDANKAHPAGVDDEQRSDSRLLSQNQRNLIKIQYNRDFNVPDNGGFRDVAVVVDRASIDNAGRTAKSITISAANTYGQHSGAGAGIEALIGSFKTTAPMWTRPYRLLDRTIDPRYFEGYSVGDVVLLSDKYARDPDTGQREISGRPAMIVKHGYSTGGAQPNSDEPADMQGGIKLLLRDVLRVAKYVPCAQVDDTSANGGLDAGTLKTFTCYAHKHSESSEAADASYFTAGRKIRIIQIDPSDPANPVTWDRIVDTQTGNTVVVTVAIGTPAWDSTKKYRIVFDNYADCLAEQQAGYTFQADDGDALIEDLRVPYEFALNPHLQFPYNSSYTHNAAADPIELPPDAASADGSGLDIGHMAAVNRLTNNLVDYKTAHSKPQLTQTEMSGAAATGTWLLCDVRPINLTSDQNALLLYRKLYVAPHFKSTDGTSASVRISLVRKMPSESSVNDVTRDNLIAEATFTTSVATYATPNSSGLNIGNIKDQYGNAFLLIELTVKARCMGLGYCQEGPREGGLVL